MEDEFFTLRGSVRDVGSQEELFGLLDSDETVYSNFSYKPDGLKSRFYPWRHRVKNKLFKNVSFTKTVIEDFEFINCYFTECLLISAIFRNCRFTSCIFVDCNPHRIEFQDCFIDPKSFKNCIKLRRYANIGVYLFQELLRNSRQQTQVDYTDEARYQLARWKRFYLGQELDRVPWKISKPYNEVRRLGLFVFDVTTGSGVRLGRLAISAAVILISISIVNWSFAESLGLMRGSEPIGDFYQAVYFSTVLITTVGFGDITPTTTVGRLAVSAEAVIGFVLLAMLTSSLYRRFSS